MATAAVASLTLRSEGHAVQLTAVAVSIREATRVVANATAVHEFNSEFAHGAWTTAGLNAASRDNRWLSYIPVIGTALYAVPDAARACAPGIR